MSVYSLFCSFSSWTVLVAHQIMPDATKASGEMDQCRVEVSHTCRNHISALPISTLLAHTAHSKPSRQSNTHHTTLKKKSALFVQITYKNKHDGGGKHILIEASSQTNTKATSLLQLNINWICWIYPFLLFWDPTLLRFTPDDSLRTSIATLVVF